MAEPSLGDSLPDSVSSPGHTTKIHPRKSSSTYGTVRKSSSTKQVSPVASLTETSLKKEKKKKDSNEVTLGNQASGLSGTTPQPSPIDGPQPDNDSSQPLINAVQLEEIRARIYKSERVLPANLTLASLPRNPPPLPDMTIESNSHKLQGMGFLKSKSSLTRLKGCIKSLSEHSPRDTEGNAETFSNGRNVPLPNSSPNNALHLRTVEADIHQLANPLPKLKHPKPKSIAELKTGKNSRTEHSPSHKGGSAERLPHGSQPHPSHLSQRTHRITTSDDSKPETETSSRVPHARVGETRLKTLHDENIVPERKQVVRDLPHLPSAKLTPALPPMPAEANTSSQGIGLWDLLSNTDITLAHGTADIDGMVERLLSRPSETKLKGIEIKPSNGIASSHSLPSIKPDHIYVERKGGRGFFKARKLKGVKPARSDTSQHLPVSSKMMSTEYVLVVHKFIQQLAIISHGLIAGISLWECIITNLVARQDKGHLAILQLYSSLVLPSHAIYFLLLSLVLLSLLDRFDIANPSKLSVRSFFRNPSHMIMLIILLLIVFALVVTLSLVTTDERIALFPQDPSLWSDLVSVVNTTSKRDRDLSVLTFISQTKPFLTYAPSVTSRTSKRILSYLVLLIVRTVCCCLSWIATVWITDYDRLRDYLETFQPCQQTSNCPEDTEH